MTEHKKTERQRSEQIRKSYQKPQLKRWGTLADLTQGGGGTRREPVTKRRTRF